MSSAVNAGRRISCRARPLSLLPVTMSTSTGSSPTRSKHAHRRGPPLSSTAMSSVFPNVITTSTSGRGSVSGQMLQLYVMRAVAMQKCRCRRHLRAVTAAEGNGTHRASPIGSIRAFGGQSVVPWELALFLVEEMKGEMVRPGAVVYTAALAECRWAGEQKHFDYLLKEMESEGVSIAPGIPGATDDGLPPSQAPPLFGKLPETPPLSTTGNSSTRTPHDNPRTDSTGDVAKAGLRRKDSAANAATAATAATTAAASAGCNVALQAAARSADAALATVETMWARGEDEPSPTTCRAAIDACAAGGQWERALALVRDAAGASAAEGVPVADDGNGISTSVSERVEALALEGKWNEALLLVQRKLEP